MTAMTPLQPSVPLLQTNAGFARDADGGCPIREVLDRVVEAFEGDVLETVISRTVKFPDASVAREPILEYAPEHRAAAAYRQLACELVSRGAIA